MYRQSGLVIFDSLFTLVIALVVAWWGPLRVPRHCSTPDFWGCYRRWYQSQVLRKTCATGVMPVCQSRVPLKASISGIALPTYNLKVKMFTSIVVHASK